MAHDYAANKDKYVTAGGKRMTTGLFFETARGEMELPPLFSLLEWRKKYVSMEDPTGYTQAMELLGDWEHWLFLRSSTTLKPYFDSWDKELEIRLRSKAIANMIKHSKTEKGQTSAKWLAEAGFKIDKEKNDKRFKQNKDTEEEVKKEVSARVKDDMERLGLKVVGGAE